MKVFKILERLFAAIVVAPPMYMAFRYMRWFFRQNQQEKEIDQ